MTNEEKLVRLREELAAVLDMTAAMARAAYTAVGEPPDRIEALTAAHVAEAKAESARAMQAARLALYGPSSVVNH